MFCLIMLSVSLSASVFTGFEFAATVYINGSRRSSCMLYGEKHGASFVRETATRANRDLWKLSTITCDHQTAIAIQPARLTVPSEYANTCEDLLTYAVPTSEITAAVTGRCNRDISLVSKTSHENFRAANPTAEIGYPATIVSLALRIHRQTPGLARTWRASGETVISRNVGDTCTISSTTSSAQINSYGRRNLETIFTCVYSMQEVISTMSIQSANYDRFLYSDEPNPFPPEHSTNHRLLKCDVLAAAMDVDLICATRQDLSQRTVPRYRRHLSSAITVRVIIFLFLILIFAVLSSRNL
jgi:hypothetical protein